MEIERQHWGIKVTDEEAGITLTGMTTMLREGRVELCCTVRDNDEIVIHGGDIEVYMALDRLSALPMMLKTFKEETRRIMEAEHGTA
jgi:hypothetical protein